MEIVDVQATEGMCIYFTEEELAFLHYLSKRNIIIPKAVRTDICNNEKYCHDFLDNLSSIIDNEISSSKVHRHNKLIDIRNKICNIDTRIYIYIYINNSYVER